MNTHFGGCGGIHSDTVFTHCRGISTLKIKTAYFIKKTLVMINQISWNCTPEDDNLHASLQYFWSILMICILLFETEEVEYNISRKGLSEITNLWTCCLPQTLNFVPDKNVCTNLIVHKNVIIIWRHMIVSKLMGHLTGSMKIQQEVLYYILIKQNKTNKKKLCGP
jgi:hypothetical protein